MRRASLKRMQPSPRQPRRPASDRKRTDEAGGGQFASDRTLSVAQARAQFADLLNQVRYRKDRVIVARHGKPIVAIIPSEDLDLLEQIEDEADTRAAKQALEDVKRHGTVPLKGMLQDLRARR